MIFSPPNYRWLNQPACKATSVDFQLALLEATPISSEFPEYMQESQKDEWLRLLTERSQSVIRGILSDSGVNLTQLEQVRARVISAIEEGYRRQKLEGASWVGANIYILLLACCWDIVTPLDKAKRAGVDLPIVLQMLKTDPRASLLPVGSERRMINYLGGDGYKVFLTAAYLLENFTEIDNLLKAHESLVLPTYAYANRLYPELIQGGNNKLMLGFWELAHHILPPFQSEEAENDFLITEQDLVFQNRGAVERLQWLNAKNHEHILNNVLSWVQKTREKLESISQRETRLTLEGVTGWQDQLPFEKTYYTALWVDVVRNPLSFLQKTVRPVPQEVVTNLAPHGKEVTMTKPTSISSNLSAQEHRIVKHLMLFPGQFINYGEQDGINGLAETLNLAAKTVRNYIATIKSKWGSGCPIRTGNGCAGYFPEN